MAQKRPSGRMGKEKAMIWDERSADVLRFMNLNFHLHEQPFGQGPIPTKHISGPKFVQSSNGWLIQLNHFAAKYLLKHFSSHWKFICKKIKSSQGTSCLHNRFQLNGGKQKSINMKNENLINIQMSIFKRIINYWEEKSDGNG